MTTPHDLAQILVEFAIDAHQRGDIDDDAGFGMLAVEHTTRGICIAAQPDTDADPLEWLDLAAGATASIIRADIIGFAATAIGALTDTPCATQMIDADTMTRQQQHDPTLQRCIVVIAADRDQMLAYATTIGIDDRGNDQYTIERVDPPEPVAAILDAALDHDLDTEHPIDLIRLNMPELANLTDSHLAMTVGAA